MLKAEATRQVPLREIELFHHELSKYKLYFGSKINSKNYFVGLKINIALFKSPENVFHISDISLRKYIGKIPVVNKCHPPVNKNNFKSNCFLSLQQIRSPFQIKDEA